MAIAILTLCSIAGLQISKPVIGSLRKAQAAKIKTATRARRATV